MDTLFDVVIVSAFGRGHWVAGELQAQGLRVSLVDVSYNLGRWAAEDWEGPFGCFDSLSLDASQRIRLIDDQEVVALPKGFCIWLKDGPIEFKSAMTPFYLDKLAIPPALIDYLTERAERTPETLKNEKRNFRAISDHSFQDAWVAHFAHQVYSPVYVPHHQGLFRGDPIPLFTSFFLRRPSRASFDKSLHELQARGVKVYSNATVKDLEIEGRMVSAIEVSSEESGVIRGQQFLWMLTSEETSILDKSMTQRLFPDGFLQPQWFWTRYRIALTDGPERFHLPQHFVMIENLHFPWTHENMVVAVQTANAENFDLWIRIPYHQRFQRRYLEQMRDGLLAQIESRIPGSHPEMVDMPLEYQYDHVEVGAPRFPVFDPDELDRFKTAKLSNLYFDSPEFWNRFDWLSQYQSQTPLKSKIVTKHLKALGAEKK